MDRIVLAYSGGLDTSVAVAWLAEEYRAEVVCVTVDLGQGQDLKSVRERALAAGAVRAHVLDVREEFARQFVLPALQAGAVFARGGPLATALGRPLIARTLVEIARIEGAGTVAHGCSSQGGDRVRIERLVRAVMPGVRVIAPACEWGLTPTQKIAYARQRGIPLPAAAPGSFDIDANLWGRSIGCGACEDPWTDPPALIYAITRDMAQCPDEPAYLDLPFEQGVPSAVSGVTMPFMDVIASVGTIAGAHGVGRVGAAVNRPAARPAVREIYEAPAAVVLHLAHRELEDLVIPDGLLQSERRRSAEYADMVDEGLWYSPVREAMDAFVATVQASVTGSVRIKLYKGSAQVVSRTPGLDGRPAESRKAD